MKNFDLQNDNIKTGFKIPEGYFENFKVEIPREKNVKPLYSKKTILYAVAAMLLITSSIISISIYTNSKTEKLHNEIETYLVNNAQISQDEIVEYMTLEDLKNVDIPNSESAETEKYLQQQEFEN